MRPRKGNRTFPCSKRFHDLFGITGGYSEAARVYGININPEFSIAAAKGDPSTTVERLDKAAIYDEAGD